MSNNFNADALTTDSLLLLLRTVRGAALRTTITELAHRGHTFSDWTPTCSRGDGYFGIISKLINGEYVVYAANEPHDKWGISTERVLPPDVKERMLQD